MKSKEQLLKEQSEIAAEIAEAKKDIAEIEAQGDTSVKGLDGHGRAKSRLAILERKLAEIEAAIPAAKRAEVNTKLEALKAEHTAALEQREKVIKDCREKIAPWFNYGGGEVFIRHALQGALPVKEATSRVLELQRALKNLS